MNENDKRTALSSLLLGVAVGDALGVPVEFRPRGSFRVTGMQGCGAHNQPPGTWSDDTSLTLCLADSLFRGFDPGDIAKNFIKWHDEGAFSAWGEVFDIGRATAKAIARLKAGVAPESAGCAEEHENGNGSLMRIAPLVFYLDGKPVAERFQITKAVSSITHAHPLSVAACFIYLEYLLKLLGGMEKKAAYAGLQSDFQKGCPYIDSQTLDKFARILRSDISALPEAAIRSGGFVIDTLEAALWCFLNTENYRDAVLRAVNLGDDSDTTGAVTGALAGLAYGWGDIPETWRKTLAGYKDIFMPLCGA
ncbi:MAG: ADP-ribosylglycohydrolase family protein [Desulfarculales bacterium]|jgi:ADP-ribosylglycohydrolase|nr:ADP-ribosylglycohydrolase family protein [Desulfarculales bacterium]